MFTTSKGDEAVKLCETKRPDVIVLDLVMQETNGLDICRRLKSSEPTRAIPILMLSGKDQPVDRVLGLELGAEDFLSKPFDFRELLARVRVILRRNEDKPLKKIDRLGDLHIDWERYEVTLGENKIHLSAKEFELLRALIHAKGRVLTRGQILEKVWNYDASAEIQTRTLDQTISHLRKKLGKEGTRIRSVQNVGYSFQTEAREGDESL